MAETESVKLHIMSRGWFQTFDYDDYDYHGHYDDDRHIYTRKTFEEAVTYSLHLREKSD